MAIHYRTKAFVLKENHIGEADCLFIVFTQDFGKLKILGRGIRKIKSKLRGGMRLFSLTVLEFIQGRTYKTLTDSALIEDFPHLRKDLKKLKIVYEISEILDILVRGQEKDDKIWELLKDTFERLNRAFLSIKECWLIYYHFLWKFFSILGYQPELNFCSICQKKLIPTPNLYFGPEEGGVICSKCFKEIKKGEKISPDIIKILRLIFKKDLDFLQKLKIQANHQKTIKDISETYLSFLKEIQS